jgi:hypothetical protein
MKFAMAHTGTKAARKGILLQRALQHFRRICAENSNLQAQNRAEFRAIY